MCEIFRPPRSLRLRLLHGIIRAARWLLELEPAKQPNPPPKRRVLPLPPPIEPPKPPQAPSQPVEDSAYAAHRRLADKYRRDGHL